MNTKAKFIEFAKEQGLIIIGYSGQDRSIMDVLNFLLQQPEYLKNGLYWCLRSDDDISPELHSLLWKEKVFCIEIDGFDECLAGLCNNLELKLEFNIQNSQSKREICLQKIIEDKFKLKNNHIINKDLDKIKLASESRAISDLLQPFIQNSSSSISTKNLPKLLNIEYLIKEEKYDEALDAIKLMELNKPNSDILNILEKLKYTIFVQKDDIDSANVICNNLINQDYNNETFHLSKAHLIDDDFSRLDFLSDCISKMKHSGRIYNSYVKCLIKIITLYHDQDNKYLSKIPEAIQFLEKSISLFPSYSNNAYKLKLELFYIYKKNCNSIKSIKR